MINSKKKKNPLVLYFLNPCGRQFSNKDVRGEVGLLKELKSRKAKVIFVVTHLSTEEWDQELDFIKYLEKENLSELIITLEENDYDTKRNIAKVELKTNKGINDLFEQIIYFSNNKSNYEENFLENLLNEVKRIKGFDERLKYLRRKSTLFKELNNKDELISYLLMKSGITITSSSLLAGAAGCCIIPGCDVPFVLATMAGILAIIANIFGFQVKNLNKEDIISIMNSKEYVGNESSERDNLHLTIPQIITIIFTNLGKLGLLLFADDAVKLIPGVGSLIGMALGAISNIALVAKHGYDCQEYFKSKLEYKDGEFYFTTKILQQASLFRQLTELVKKFS